jgi:tartrate-resistant acid phosphatase type 5
MINTRRTLKFALIAVFVLIILAATVIYVEYRVKTTGLSDTSSNEDLKHPFSYRSVSFLIIGDSGSNTKSQKSVALGMERRCRKKYPEGIIIVGDVVYPNGVISANDPQWEQKVFSIYSGNCLSSIPIFPVPGNHDYLGSIEAWLEKSKTNDRWNYPSRHYSVEMEDLVTLYGIDSVYPTNIKKFIPDIGKATTPWTLAIGHHPIQSTSAKGGGHKGGGARSVLLRRALCDTVDDYIAGHAHHLEYSHINDCTANQLISGGGGAALYEIETPNKAEFAESRYGYIELEYFKKKSIVRIFSDNGEVIFSKIRHKPQS